jgi:hypothetical protein
MYSLVILSGFKYATMRTRINKERLLMRSLSHGTAVGIKLKDADDLIVSAVTDFSPRADHEKWIEIKPYTLYGKPVQEHVFPLHRIEYVVSYSVRYDDPLYVRLREIKRRILGIQ